MSLPAGKLQRAADLCRELSSLARLGLPWEGSITRACEEIEQRLASVEKQDEQSWSSSRELRQLGLDVDRLPSSLRGILDISVQTGAPGDILATLSPVLSRAAQWRRSVTQALLYPVIVAVCAGGVIGGLSRWYVPLWQETWGDLLPDSAAWQATVWVSDHFLVVSLVLLAISVALIAVWAGWSHHASGIAFLPRHMRTAYAVSLFLQSLACLVRHRVPLDRGLPLAAQLTDDGRIIQDAHRLCQSIRTDGEFPSHDAPRRIPRRLHWLVSSASSPDQLADSLVELGAEYECRGDALFDRWKRWMPFLALVLIGGSTTFVAVYVVLSPYAAALVRALS